LHLKIFSFLIFASRFAKISCCWRISKLFHILNISIFYIFYRWISLFLYIFLRFKKYKMVNNTIFVDYRLKRQWLPNTEIYCTWIYFWIILSPEFQLSVVFWFSVPHLLDKEIRRLFKILFNRSRTFKLSINILLIILLVDLLYDFVAINLTKKLNLATVYRLSKISFV
jgi:hypothetical protein